MESSEQNQRASISLPSANMRNKRAERNNDGARKFADITVSKDNCNWKLFQQTTGNSQSSKPPTKHPVVVHHATTHEENKTTHPSRTSVNSRDSSVKYKATSVNSRDSSVKYKAEGNSKVITNAVAIDCEMVGVDTGNDNMLARVSIVNKYGNCIYDKYVKPTEHIVDYRTHVSGIRPKDLVNAEDFETVQKEVAEIIKGRILVGHALKNDLKVLYLSHPRRQIRDTSRYKGFRKLIKGGTPGLKRLAKELMGVKIQEGEHDSVIDARTAMQLYMLYNKEWEKSHHSKHKRVNCDKSECQVKSQSTKHFL